jgi:hypothetical protein
MREPAQSTAAPAAGPATLQARQEASAREGAAPPRVDPDARKADELSVRSLADDSQTGRSGRSPQSPPASLPTDTRPAQAAPGRPKTERVAPPAADVVDASRQAPAQQTSGQRARLEQAHRPEASSPNAERARSQVGQGSGPSSNQPANAPVSQANRSATVVTTAAARDAEAEAARALLREARQRAPSPDTKGGDEGGRRDDVPRDGQRAVDETVNVTPPAAGRPVDTAGRSGTVAGTPGVAGAGGAARSTVAKSTAGDLATKNRSGVDESSRGAASDPNILRSVNGSRWWRIRPPATIEVSADAGATWTVEYSDPAVRLLHGVVTPNGGCWMIGERGAVLRLRPGLGWERVTSPSNRSLVSIAAADPLSATVIDDQQRTYQTTDGGRTWRASQP